MPSLVLGLEGREISFVWGGMGKNCGRALPVQLGVMPVMNSLIVTLPVAVYPMKILKKTVDVIWDD
jgi:hypothetical protein